MAEPYRETRSDGTYEYNAVTDRWYNVSDYTGKTRSTSTRKSDYEELKDRIKSAAGRDGFMRTVGSDLYVRVTYATMSVEQKSELHSLIQENVAKYERNLEAARNGRMKEASRDNAIDVYKATWRKKNPLWKLFHQKYNPKKQDLESMSEITAESYTRRMK